MHGSMDRYAGYSSSTCGRKASAGRAPRCSLKGRVSAWFIKGKSDGVKAKWFQSLGRRYFTIDFDRQIFYYAYSESRKSQVSKPIHFRDILGAHTGHSYEPDDLGCPRQAKVTRSLSGVLSRPRPLAPGIFPFTVRTRGKRLRLEAEVETDAFRWIAMLNAAHRIGENVDMLSSSSWLSDAPAASPSSRSPRSEAPPSVTSEKASQMSTTADADENCSDGLPSPTSGPPLSETYLEDAEPSQELLHMGDDTTTGADEPAQSMSLSCPQASSQSCLKATDFGFDEDEWDEGSNAASTPRSSVLHECPEGPIEDNGDEEAQELEPEKEVVEVVEERCCSASTVPSKSWTSAEGYIVPTNEGRVAADLQLLQAEAAKRSFRLMHTRPDAILE
mmetsp:Transcript_55850/g.104776  ORF Transcript_55850/g.104776 Transcript_55850/m.104776 type:complete len:389 (+) Transcript_55850:79-1245(+)